ncbi:hypothetical protein P879_03565 [Paragonimus westermani]|uniref:Regulating synaptic membrane exocytosis protein 2 n=1 Tax=Paragonimus westermani TaxID=34504 RepID=A0A8T0DDU4_9TREM|nr:hypothetical protein P879_03565 [Paragonimus westermani]
MQPALGEVMDTICAICQKTKFADGVGHTCAQCKKKTCTRCGYQLNTGINQVQWACKSCAQHLDQTVSHPDSSLTANEDNAAGRLVSGFVGLITGQSSKGVKVKTPTLSSAIKRQYTEDALDRGYQARSESGFHQYDILSGKTLQRGDRVRGQYSRPVDNNQSHGFSRHDLQHYYYTDSLTSEQSDSPARAHSTAGWPTAYQPSPMAGRYSIGGAGRSDNDAYDVDPRGGDRFGTQSFHARLRSEPNERDYPLFSSSEGEDFNMGYEDQFYSDDIDVTSQRPQTTLYTDMPDMSVDERLLLEDDSYDDNNVYAEQEATAGLIEPHPIRDRVIRQQYPYSANECSLKVVGGRRTHSGHLGAFITRVKPGSPADVIGQLQAGDEVLEWNGSSLKDLLAEEVSQIIQETRDAPQIELIVQRENDEMKYSKMISDNNNPDWNQVFKFVDYTEQEIVQHDLELTVWNCELDTNEQTLLGEVIIDLSVADLTGGTYWYPLRFSSKSEYSSEAATPVIGTDPEYAKRQMKLRSPVHSSVDHRRRSQQQHSGDYSDLDEQRSLAHAGSTSQDYHYDRSPLSISRGQQIHPRKHVDNNYDESMVHSDASEFSDISEFSRMSLQTTQSEKPHHLSPHSSERSPYQKPSPQSTGSSKTVSHQFPHHRQPLNRSSPTNDPYEQSRISRRPIDEHSARRRTGSGHSVEQNQLAKESSSSECGSSLLTASGGETVSQYLKPEVALRTAGDRPSQIQPSGRTDGSKARPSIGHKFSTVLGRSHKSSSTSNLDKKGRNRFQRCEEVLPFGTQDSLPESQYGPTDQGHTSTSIRRNTMQQQSSLGSMRSPIFGNSDGTDQDSRASPSLSRNESHVGEFVEGLGPGQLVGRQVLGMPCLGEIQLSFFDRKGHLEVEVIRARGLQHKNSAKPIPAPYVKLHLLEGKQSVEKIRTTTLPRRTLDPLYQQQLTFSMPYHGRIIQVSVWGEYGRMDKKVFLGMCEVVLDDLDLKNVVFGWYKLFGMIASSAHHQHHNPTAKCNQSESQSTMDSHSGQTQSKGLSEQSPPKTRQLASSTRIKKSPFTR